MQITVIEVIMLFNRNKHVSGLKGLVRNVQFMLQVFS